MNKRDLLIEKYFPTVMAPKYEEITPCEHGMTRLIIAEDGLYIETKRVWGSLIKKLWHSDRKLPYGRMEEVDTFIYAVRKAQSIIQEEVIPIAAGFADNNQEWAGQIVYTTKGFKYLPVEFEATSVKASYELPKLAEGEEYFMDIHSHGKMPPFFSPIDNEDDKGGVRVCLVLGNFSKLENSKDQKFTPDWKLRYIVEGFFFDFEDGSHDDEQT